MSINSIVEELKKNISSFEKQVEVEEVGTVIEVGDGIARLSGLEKCQASEMLEFPGGTFGVALNLEEDTVGSIVLGNFHKIKQGDTVRATGKILSVPVGEALIGRVVDALGQSKDGKGEIKTDKLEPVINENKDASNLKYKSNNEFKAVESTKQHQEIKKAIKKNYGQQQ